MGTEVEGLPGGPRVDAPREPAPPAAVAAGEPFGRWFGQERRLREIPLIWVAARTKLKPERIAAIEAGEEPLGHDAPGRSVARTLAAAIGADPEAAAGLLRGEADADPPASRWRRTRPDVRVSIAFSGPALAFALAAAVGLGVWALWAGTARDADPIGPVRSTDVIYRTDYVGNLLAAPSTSSARPTAGRSAPGWRLPAVLEGDPGVGETPARPSRP